MFLLYTLIVLVILVAVIVGVVGVAVLMFNNSVRKQVNQLIHNISNIKTEIIRKEDLAGLPLPVQKWLIGTHIIGKEKIINVRLEQIGKMRTKEDGHWMPVQAVQYFRVDEPGFVWKAYVKMAPLLHMSGLDNYQEGKGKMNIKLLSLFSVVKAKGPEMDFSTMVRYLAEMPWFPTAALHSYIQWEVIDEHSSRATMSYQGVSASGVFSFNEKSDLISFNTKRYKEINGKYVLSDWGGINTEFKEFNGIRIPSKSEVIWKEKSGDFNWFQLEIKGIEYNQRF
ncbi:DUF6544 family protein [Paenibacillus wynnii]|uniref:Uncharacterized protein n=1 Tax=Paenibacillus wynnii TaxID=268407 RepID=A0A098M3H2_9BACL|nr:DUF6544 family protein [Paenibacillus wynnii]KGE16558.1 hypothetical protein PWYN_17730 [Paenibacillus wynnii]